MCPGVGVPLMLTYVYGVVPMSLCRNGWCRPQTERPEVHKIQLEDLANCKCSSQKQLHKCKNNVVLEKNCEDVDRANVQINKAINKLYSSSPDHFSSEEQDPFHCGYVRILLIVWEKEFLFWLRIWSIKPLFLVQLRSGGTHWQKHQQSSRTLFGCGIIQYTTKRDHKTWQLHILCIRNKVQKLFEES